MNIFLGKHFRVGTMISRDSVKNRLAGSGISFTEFSYQVLQAYDFYHLAKTENCLIQVGGSDQWGNIVGGCTLIEKLLGKESFALIVPLLTDATGSKCFR